MRILIVYGTRYGATAETSQEIAKILGRRGHEVSVVDAKEEKVNDISGYDVVIVGSGLQMGQWTGEADGFLRRFSRELANKRHAVFVSTMKMVSEREGKAEEMVKQRKIVLDDKITDYGLHPIAVGFFGGVLDYNKMNWIFKRTMGFLKPQLEKDGFKETRPGVYDLRDWEEIRRWGEELAEKII